MWVLWLCVVAGLWPSLCFGDQDSIDYLAENVNIEYFVINNLLTYDDFTGELQLTNTGPETVTDLSWSLYFCSIRLFEPNTIRPDGAPLGNTNLMVYHINGCLHRIAPTPLFSGLLPLQTLVVPFTAQYFQITATETMPNWYFDDDLSTPRIALTTEAEGLSWVGPFNTPNQWKRSPDDLNNPFTGEDRYNNIQYEDLGSAQSLILPSPAEENLNPSLTVSIVPGTWFVVPLTPGVQKEAQFLADSFGMTVVDPSQKPSTRFFELDLGTVLDSQGQPVTGPEAHRFDITGGVNESVSIVGTDSAGVFYAVQSLISLFAADRDIPTGFVVDYPRLEYRGIFLDVARNFYSKEEILKVLDTMAMFKLNKFHFHLTDDEAWRLEIPTIPELSEIGSRRCHDPSGDLCLLPQLGSGPSILDPTNGFYSVSDYREILTYANDRHIQVIPEIDGPGHAHAAINAMNARFRKYETTDPVEAAKYLLADPDDESDYFSIQMFTDNAINPCIESTYDFMYAVMLELKQMHSDIQPLTTFNYGGDEVPPGAWENSPACAAISSDTDFLKSYYVQRLAELAASEGMDLSGWEDGFMSSGSPISGLPNTNLYAYAYNNVWEWGGGENAYVLANAGYKTILAAVTHLYFDHPAEPDPYDRGLYWGTRFSSNLKTFGFMPDDLYGNIEIDINGNPISEAGICAQFSCTPLSPGNEGNIIGIQGHIFSETVRTSEQFQNMMYPRFLSIAERGWHKAAWESVVDQGDREAARLLDFESFANTLGYKELSRLDNIAVAYGVNPPGVRVISSILQAKSEFPGLPIYYSLDLGQTWTLYDGPVLLGTGTVQVVSRSADSVRSSRVVEVEVL